MKKSNSVRWLQVQILLPTKFWDTDKVSPAKSAFNRETFLPSFSTKKIMHVRVVFLDFFLQTYQRCILSLINKRCTRIMSKYKSNKYRIYFRYLIELFFFFILHRQKMLKLFSCRSWFFQKRRKSISSFFNPGVVDGVSN